MWRKLPDSQIREIPPWVRFRTTRRPPPSAPTIPMGTDGFEFVEFAHPEPEELHALFSGWAMRRSPATRPRTSRSIARATSTISSTPSPIAHGSHFVAAHGPCAPSMALRVVDAQHAFERALSLGAEPPMMPADDKTLDVPGHQGHRRLAALFRRSLRREGLALRRRVRLARRANPRPAGRRLLLPRPPDPQCLSRPHGQVVRLLRKAVQLPADPLLRHRGQAAPACSRAR